MMIMSVKRVDPIACVAPLWSRLICVLILLPLLVGCTGIGGAQTVQDNESNLALRQIVTSIDSDGSPLSVVDEEWRLQTISLLERTRTWEGVYAGDLYSASVGPYDLYATYYATHIYDLLGNQPANKDATIQQLQASQKMNGQLTCEESTRETSNQFVLISQIDCIYYTVMILDMLEAKPQNVDALVESLLQLQTPTGVFAPDMVALQDVQNREPDLIADLLPTLRAVTALAKLDAQPAHMSELRDFLLGYWNDDTLFDSNLENIYFTYGIAQTLEILDVPLQTLPNASQRLAWLHTLQSTMFQSEQIETDLFIIQAWIKMTQLLDDGFEPQEVLDAAFFAKLAHPQTEQTSLVSLVRVNGDLQDISIITNLLTLAEQEPPYLTELSQLLERYMLDQGGFLPVVQQGYVEASLVYMSWYIHTALSGQEDNLGPLQQYVEWYILQLSQQDDPTMITMDDLYQTVRLAQAVDVPTTELAPLITRKVNDLKTTIMDTSTLPANELSTLYVALQLVDWEPEVQRRVQEQVAALLERDLRSLGPETIWLVLQCLMRVGVDVTALEQRAALIEALAHQRVVDGYHALGATEPVPDAVTTYFAVQSLTLLEEPVPDEEQLMQWLRSLQSPYGAYTFTSSTQVPDLLATYYMVQLANDHGLSL